MRSSVARKGFNLGNMQHNKDTVNFAIKKSTLNAALIVFVAFAGGFGSAWFIFGRTTPQAPNQPTSQQALDFPPELEGRPSLGPEDARVTIVEFTDYECPFCGRHFRETMPQLINEYEDTIKYVVLNFPISRIHPFAQQTGEAAECAHDQGKFWEYHDMVFQNQAALDVENLKLYAEQVGLDTVAFGTCLDSGAKTQLVLDDVQDALSYGVSGTPTFFINGQMMVGAQPFSSFQTLIDDALEK